MARKAAGLTAQKVAKAGPGRYGDGNGLYLLVRPPKPDGEPGGRFWLFRYVRDRKMREMGLGRAPGPTTDKGAVALSEARAKAGTLFKQVRDGVDPLAKREEDAAAARATAQREAFGRITFRDVTDRYIEAHERKWRNAKHRWQWRQSLESFVFPHMGSVPISEIATGHVTAALEPIWAVKTETAARVRGRIEAILDYAKVRGWRSGENPARWRGNLANLFPKRSELAAVRHHPALGWREVGAFMVELRQREAVAALALELAILTAARTGEVLGARWQEIDLGESVWIVPAVRMKAKVEHRVPLSPAAVAVLEKAAATRTSEEPDAFVFPGKRRNAPLSQMALMMLMRRMERGDMTVHGFRSTFRDWTAERTRYPREVAEAALAHASARSTVEAAYFRSDLFDQRRRLMADWAEFCARPFVASGQVVPIRTPAPHVGSTA